MNARKRSSTGLWIAVILLAVLLMFSVMVNLGVLAVTFVGREVAASTGPFHKRSHLQEEWTEGKGDLKVLRLDLSGVIMRGSPGGGLFGGGIDMVESMKRKIKAAEEDRNVRAIVLEVNSPGGAVTSTDEIYKALMDFKQSGKDRRVIAFVRDMAVSGSYWVSVAGDRIIAEPTSVIGSIGVLLQSYNWSDLSKKIGVTDTTIKSGENKDLLNPFRKTSPEQKELLQRVIDGNFDLFKEVVRENRGLNREDLDLIADGRIMTAHRALETGLIDQIGYWDDVMACTKEVLGVENFRTIRYRQRRNLFEVFASATARELGSLFRAKAPRLMSIWE